MITSIPYESNEQLTKHINAREIRCKCGKMHATLYDTETLNKIEQLISAVADYHNTTSENTHIYISSGYRCPEHDKAVGGNGKGTHTAGYALDFRMSANANDVDNRVIAALAKDAGFTGIGIMHGNYIHVDNAPVSMHGGRKWLGDETKPGGTSGSVITDSGSYWEYYGIKPPAAKPKTLDMQITLDGVTYAGTLTEKR